MTTHTLTMGDSRTGKTYAAGIAIDEHIDAGGIAVVHAPHGLETLHHPHVTSACSDMAATMILPWVIDEIQHRSETPDQAHTSILVVLDPIGDILNSPDPGTSIDGENHLRAIATTGHNYGVRLHLTATRPNNVPTDILHQFRHVHLEIEDAARNVS